VSTRRVGLLEEAQNLAGRGMPAERLLGEHLAPVHLDLEHASRRLDELHCCLRVRLADLGRQTGGPGFVVSNDAVFDHYAHTVYNSRA
jgi:hypothetical protein